MLAQNTQSSRFHNCTLVHALIPGASKVQGHPPCIASLRPAWAWIVRNPVKPKPALLILWRKTIKLFCSDIMEEGRLWFLSMQILFFFYHPSLDAPTPSILLVSFFLCRADVSKLKIMPCVFKIQGHLIVVHCRLVTERRENGCPV